MATPKELKGMTMLFVKLFDIYTKINACPRKMGALEVVCLIGDLHRDGTEWVRVKDLAENTQQDPANLSRVVQQLLKEGLIERKFLGLDGEMTEARTKTPIIKLEAECLAAIGGVV
ncbi:MarR family transcriptional regulator [Vibrio mediterranei]|uniref:HTH marR-type domain-containing protein n=1 Tax=Vibrio mediterranei TaxID=689 RepID=A0ABX5D9I5_9VIBR|nr:helix-turn-helix domain-containing protein [Vibrio mediterranei]MCG9659928.1 MarR family transcriptional regulator [Vibrio mediterranei]PRQ65135.1 hypothetical protein COR51_23730 [Vibrio mediterranei]